METSDREEAKVFIPTLHLTIYILIYVLKKTHLAMFQGEKKSHPTQLQGKKGKETKKQQLNNKENCGLNQVYKILMPTQKPGSPQEQHLQHLFKTVK